MPAGRILLTTVADVVPTEVESDEAPNWVGSVDWQVTLPPSVTVLIAELLVHLPLTRTWTTLGMIR